MNYQKIECRIWDDERFRQLSDAAKVIFFNLLANKNGNLIGLFVIRRGYIMEDTSKKEAEVIKAMEEILKHEWMFYDEQTSVLFIKNYLESCPVVTGDKVTSAVKILEKLPKNKLLQLFRKQLDDPDIRDKGKNADLIPAVDRILTSMGITVDTPAPIDPKKEDLNKKPKINVEGLVDTWNEICVPVLSRVLSVHPSRESAIKARLRERPDLEEWKGIFRGIMQSPFLIGENDRGWSCDFDWVMKPANLAKVIEGHWLKSGNKSQPSTTSVKTTSIWEKCKKCKKETLLASLNENGLCFNCNPEAEGQTQRLKELIAVIGKPIPKETSTTSSSTETTDP